MRVRVKICGITRTEDALACVDAGADALGFVFHDKSPRCVSAERARSIIERLPPFVTPIGVFVDLPCSEVRRIVDVAGVAVAQFHGDESSAACDAARIPYIKAVSVSGQVDVEALESEFPRASGVLLDSSVFGKRGGSGLTFDWQSWPRSSRLPLILAGGLTVENVAAAIAATRPYAVDVSTGVEAAPGIKDHHELRAFIGEVARASQGH